MANEKTATDAANKAKLGTLTTAAFFLNPTLGYKGKAITISLDKL